MASYATTITPRLRVARTSLNYDRSVSQIATATEGPSHLPDFSQLVDLNLNEMAPSEASEQPSTSTVLGPSTSTRSENPAAVLRALLSRLPAEPRSPPPSQSPSQQYLSERESDYDMDFTEPANAARSMVQENLKDIFSKARRDPGDTPQKVPTRCNNSTASEEDFNSTTNMRRDDSRGKRRSSSDDELDNTNGFSQRPPTRFKYSPQPVTLEFLRERFSDTQFSNGSIGDDEHPPSIHHFSNDAAALSQELNSFQTNIPVATSTPQQSLRMSFDSQFQSNLLDQDTEMQHAIDGLDSYGESSANRLISPPILWKRPTSRLERLTPVASDSIEDNNKTPTMTRSEFRLPSPASLRSNNISSDRRDRDGMLDLDHNQLDDSGQSRISHGPSHSRRSKFESLDEPAPRAGNRGQPSVYRPSTPSRGGPLLDEVPSENESLHSTTPPNSPPYANIQQGQSFSQENLFSASIVEDHDYDEFQNTSIAEGKRRFLHSNWNTPSVPRPLTPPSISPPTRVANTRLRSNSFRSVNESKADSHSQSISAGDYSNLASSQDARRSISPLHSSPSGSSPGLGRASSLQAIDNTYHNDPSLRHRLRSRSPVPSSFKVDSKSPNMLNTSTGSRLDIPSSDWKHASSHEWASSTPDLSVRSSSSQSKQAIRTSLPRSSHLDSNRGQNDKTRETDLSSQDKTPKMKPVPVPSVSDFNEERPVTPPSRASSRLSNAPTIPHVVVTGQMSPSNPSEKTLLSPSKPSRRTPKNTRRGYKLPSPTKGPPDLPTPSSSDESSHSPWDHAVTPKSNINGGSNASWFPTPRPPGGWLQTPMPPRIRSEPFGNNVDDHPTLNNEANTDSDSLPPKTPLRAVNTTSNKTPRPPGAWQTPAPVPKPAYPPDKERDRESTQDLLTPAPSLSKGSFPDPKTPYVPGGWTTTPAARKSILKVRFDQGEETSSVDNTPARNTHTSDEYAAKKMATEDSSSTSPPSSRTPRHTQESNIRVLDAYGQEVSDDLAARRLIPSRNALRVVDSMGRAVQESDQTVEDESIDEDVDYSPSSRTELLSRIRRGLDNLVEDIDEIDKENDARSKDEARMEELNALSVQARKNRERLFDQATNFQNRPDEFQSNVILSKPFEPKSRPSNRRLYIIMLLVQMLLVLMMYRLSVHRARELFLNSYYDPFNPDLYLYVFKYDTSFQLFKADFSRSSPRSLGDVLLQGGGKAWINCFHLWGAVKSYIWKLWAVESASLHTTTWAPT